ncbi:hypothetical protein KCU81_g668, partial [Aureobasidium melanogenum]
MYVKAVSSLTDSRDVSISSLEVRGEGFIAAGPVVLFASSGFDWMMASISCERSWISDFFHASFRSCMAACSVHTALDFNFDGSAAGGLRRSSQILSMYQQLALKRLQARGELRTIARPLRSGFREEDQEKVFNTAIFFHRLAEGRILEFVQEGGKGAFDQRVVELGHALFTDKDACDALVKLTSKAMWQTALGWRRCERDPAAVQRGWTSVLTLTLAMLAVRHAHDFQDAATNLRDSGFLAAASMGIHSVSRVILFLGSLCYSCLPTLNHRNLVFLAVKPICQFVTARAVNGTFVKYITILPILPPLCDLSLQSTPPSNTSSSTTMSNNNAGANFADKPRLTEQEKKNNHIASEQKRRQAIREGFDRLAEIVPGMSGQGRSEAVMLSATVTYMRTQLAKKEALRDMAAKLNVSDGDFEQMYREERARINQSYDRA